MATNVKVIGPGFKQVTIKVNPSTHLTDILEQACTKLKVDAGRYLLKHKQKQVDLSHTWRTVGLPPGASLELVVRSNSPTVLNIGLQLPPEERHLFPPQGRLVEKLPNDFTLWKVLRQFESGTTGKSKNLNITARGTPRTDAPGSGQLYYETPVLRLGNDARQFSTFVDFQKTMAQLGYNSSSVLIHLSFQQTDKTYKDAFEEIDMYFKEQEADEAGKKTSPETPKPEPEPEPTQAAEPATNPELPSAPENIASLTAPEPMEVDQKAAQPISDANRPITVFSAPSSSTPAAALESDSEDAFVPGVDNAKAHQRLLQSAGENRRLLSDAELEERAAAAQKSLKDTQSVRIKVRLPDNTSIQAPFGQDDTGATLYALVRDQMARPNAKFRLVLPPEVGGSRNGRISAGAGVVVVDNAASSSGSSGQRSNHRLILGYGLRADTVINFVWADEVPLDVRRGPVLKDSAAASAQNVFIPKVPDAVDPGADDAEEAARRQRAAAMASSSASGGGSGEGGAFKKPKWLKGFGKK